MNSKNRIIWSILTFVLIMSLFAFTATIEYQRTYQSNIKKTQDQLMIVKTNLENIITSRMLALNGLKAYAEIHPDFNNEEFDYFAKGIYESSNDVVRGMFFLTDTTLTHTYPYEINKAALGIDLALNEEQKDWINYAKNMNKSIITAPVNLVEGGTGIVVRVPVMFKGSYFGQVSIVFNYTNTMEAVGLVELAKDNYVELSNKNEFSQKEKIVWSNFDHKKIEKNESVSKKLICMNLQ